MNPLGSSFDDTLAGGANPDHISGSNGKDLIVGREGHDPLLGNVGFDTQFGGTGNDCLFGGGVMDGGSGRDYLNGSILPDIFVFSEGRGRADGFDPSDDVLDLTSATRVLDYQDLLQGHIQAGETGTLITGADRNFIYLSGVFFKDLTEGDFIVKHPCPVYGGCTPGVRMSPPLFWVPLDATVCNPYINSQEPLARPI